VRLAVERSALKRIALRRFVLWRFAFIRSAPERFGSIERFFPHHEFQGALATLMASWPPLFWVLAYHLLDMTYHIGGGG
jgi:hypothetical protein